MTSLPQCVTEIRTHASSITSIHLATPVNTKPTQVCQATVFEAAKRMSFETTVAEQKDCFSRLIYSAPAFSQVTDRSLENFLKKKKLSHPFSSSFSKSNFGNGFQILDQNFDALTGDHGGAVAPPWPPVNPQLSMEPHLMREES